MARILLVEDHNDTRVTLQRLLRLDQHDVVAADCLAAACDAIRRHDRFDVLISDMLLPDGYGWDLLTRVDGDKKPAAAIALTGSTGLENEQHSLRNGFCVHLNKPVTFDALMQAIRECLEQN